MVLQMGEVRVMIEENFKQRLTLACRVPRQRQFAGKIMVNEPLRF